MPSDFLSQLLLEITRASQELQGAINNPTFGWNGAEYVCIYKWVKQKYLNAGGFVPMDDLVLQVQGSILPEPGPELEDLVTFQGKEFRIQSIIVTPGDYLTLNCYDPNRGT